LPDEYHVQAHDAGTGEMLWRVPVAERPHTPSVTERTVLVHDGETLYALDTASGAEKWTADLRPRVDSILPTADGILVVAYGDDNEELVSLDPDGRENWRVTVPHPMIGSKLAWANHRAYLATTDAKLVAFDTTEGAVAWTKNLQDGHDTAPARLAATPCAVFAAIDGVLYAVNRNGTPAWTVEAGIREMATDGETIYGLNVSGYVSAFGVADGEQRWEQFFGIENPRYTDGFFDDPAVDAKTLFAGTLDEKLLAVSTDDGSERWIIEREWANEALVSVVDGTLYTGWGRHLVAYR
jgi:outer membrane protein assembly factor BamB